MKWNKMESNSNFEIYINSLDIILKKEILNTKTIKDMWKIYIPKCKRSIATKICLKNSSVPYIWANKKIKEYLEDSNSFKFLKHLKKKQKEKIYKKSNSYSNYWKGKAEKLWKEIILIKYDYRCVINNYCSKSLTAHHLISRRINKYKYDIENGIVLCRKHHINSPECSAHSGTLGFVYWIQEYLPEKWKWYLKIKQNLDDKIYGVNHKKAYEELLSIKNELNNDKIY